MKSLLARLVLNAVSIYVAAYLVPGMEVNGARGALIAAVAFGLMNFFVRPVLLLLTLPLTLLTLGLFVLIVNAATLGLTAYVVDSLHVADFRAAVLGALLIAICNWLLGVSERKRDG